MSRKKRLFVPSGIYHVIIRGNDRQNIFIDDEDRKLLINRIKKYSDELNIDIYAYCLMNSFSVYI
ncbi:MAG: transposase [Treponema sp.]|nr:transposase [Treponema sp.]